MRRQRTAFPPNFIHSLDGSHMMMTAVACKRAGVCFAGSVLFSQVKSFGPPSSSKPWSMFQLTHACKNYSNRSSRLFLDTCV